MNKNLQKSYKLFKPFKSIIIPVNTVTKCLCDMTQKSLSANKRFKFQTLTSVIDRLIELTFIKVIQFVNLNFTHPNLLNFSLHGFLTTLL